MFNSAHNEMRHGTITRYGKLRFLHPGHSTFLLAKRVHKYCNSMFRNRITTFNDNDINYFQDTSGTDVELYQNYLPQVRLELTTSA